MQTVSSGNLFTVARLYNLQPLRRRHHFTRWRNILHSCGKRPGGHVH